MSNSIVVAWPSCAKIKSLVPTFTQPAQVNRSEFTSRRQVTILGIAPRWSYKVEPYPAVDLAQQWAWEAFLVDLTGPAGSFRLPISVAQLAFEPGLTAAPGQFGYTLNVNAVRRVQLRRGMKLTVNDQPVMVMADAVIAPGTTTALPVKSYLRTVTVGGEAITSVVPYALVSLKTPDAASWSIDDMKVLGTSFECEESL